MPADLTVAVISDVHASEPSRQGGPGGARSLELCLEAIAHQPAAWQPDFGFLLGDLHPWAFPDGLPDPGYPLHAVAGNHEFGERRQQLRELFPRDFQRDGAPADYYAFVEGGVRCIAVCDAGAGGDHVGHLSSQAIEPHGQLAWLEDQLGQPEAHKLLFAHIPPHPECADHDMSLGANDARWLRDLCDGTRPTAMFCGHQHLPTRRERFGQTPLHVLRSAAWNFDGVPTGFLLMRVTEGGVETRELLTM